MDPATGRVPPFAPSVSQPVHRLHPAGCRRLRHQHHRLEAAEPEGAAAVARRRAAARRAARWCASTCCTTTAATSSSAGRSANGVQSGGRRPGSRRQPRVERGDRSTTPCWWSSSGGSRAGSGSAPPTRCRRPTTTPTTIRSRSAAARSTRTICAASTDRRRTISGIVSSLSGIVDLGGRFQLSGLWTLASGVPMDILMPSGQSRIPTLQRNAGGRQFTSAARAERLHPRHSTPAAASTASGCRWSPESARFNDTFNSLDLRLSRPFSARADADRSRWSELFNLFNVTNILGTTTAQLLGLRQRAGPGFERSRQPRLPDARRPSARRSAPRAVSSGRAARSPCSSAPACRSEARHGPLRRVPDGGTRLWPAIALVIGHTIGIGIFLTPAELIGTVASPALTIGVWVVCGGLVLAGAFTFGELASRYPHAGGVYVYLREGWGERIAFLYGWQSLLIMDPGVTAALASGMSEYAIVLWPSAQRRRPAASHRHHLGAGASEHRRPDAQHARARRDDRRQVLAFAGVVAAAFAASHGSWSHFDPLLRTAVGDRPTGRGDGPGAGQRVLLVRRLLGGEPDRQ